MDKNSKSKAAKNIFITGIAQGWRLVTSFLLTIITARYLTPADFGILAMVASATALIALVKDLGISQAVIQSQMITPGQINSLFWVSTIAAIILSILLALSAPVLASFYAEPRVEGLTIAAAALLFVSGPQSVPTALLNRESKFNALAIIDVTSAALSVLVGVIAVVLWRSYWALFASAVMGTVVSAVGCWYFSKYRPAAPHIDWKSSHLIQFGSQLSGFNLLNYLSRNADNVLIGRFLGGDQLGLYDRAYRLLLFPLNQLHGPIGQVLIPLLSRIQNDPTKYRSTYADTISIMMMVAQPGILLATMFAPQVFVLLLGDQWIGAAPIFQWLGIAALHQIVTSTGGWLFISQGRGREFLMLGVYGSILTVTSFVIGLPWGAVGVAASYTIGNCLVMVPLVWTSIGRRGAISCWDLITIVSPHILATLASAALLWIAPTFLSGSTALQVAQLGLLSYTAYLCVIVLFASKRELIHRTIRLAARNKR